MTAVIADVDLPAGWKRRPLRYVAAIDPGKSEVAHLPDDLRVSFIPMEDVGFGGVLEPTESRRLGDVRDGYTYLRDGDVTFAKISPSFQNQKGGRAEGLVNGLGFATSELTVLRPRQDVDGRYLQYVISSDLFVGAGCATLHGVAGQQRVDSRFVRDFQVPLPSLEVQRRVADMLDAETARIDTLIAKNNDVLRLSDLRREATISLYVSGGMDARDPVEAFVAQPAMKHGWRLTKLKYVAQGITVGIVVRPAELYVDSPEEGVPCLRGVNVKRGQVVDTDLRFIGHAGNAANPKSQLRRGDVVVVRTGEAGVAAVVPEWAWGGNCVDLLLVRTGPGLDPRFAEFVLNSDFVRRQVARGSVGSIQSHFNVASLAEAIVAVPEIEQQRMIVEDLQHRLAPLRRLREKVEHQVELLNMRRRALITAAVTGQITV